MDEPTGIIGWILAALTTVVSTFAGIIAMFSKPQIADYKLSAAKMETQHAAETGYLKAKITELEKRADACEDDRAQIAIKHARLEERVSSLEANKKNRDSI